jgi:hypothetical protein
MTLTRLLKAALVYFALVFGAGFVLGPIRILWLVPRIGVRAAELLEMPLMIAVTFFAARWVVRRFVLWTAMAARLAVGAVALTFLAAAELALAVGLGNVSAGDYIANRDPVSGAAYLIALGLFALMPALSGHLSRT